MPSARRNAQTSIYETTIENPEIEEALRSREDKASRLSTARQNYENANERAQELLKGLDLGDGTVVRIGAFIVTSKMDKGRDVAFKTDPQMRIRIKPVKE